MIIYRFWIGQTMPNRYRECIEYSEPRIRACGHTQELIHIQPIVKTNPQQAADMKDRLSLAMACRENAWFADSDIYLEYVPELEPGRPAFAFEFGMPQVGLFCVNGCQQYFEYLQRKAYSLNLKGYGYPRILLRGEPVQAIPEDAYVHKRIMTARPR